MKRNLFSILFLTFIIPTSLLFSQTKKSADTGVVRLAINKPFEREMKGDEIHKYRIDLKSQQFLFGRVEQKGTDIVVKILDPKGKTIDEIDSPTGDRGFENILLVSESKGGYVIEIHPFDPLATTGAYNLRIEKLEDAATTVTGRVDQLFTPWDRKDSPGAAIGVVRNGEVICKKGYGIANLEYEIPITPSTVFHMASVSKQFTAFAIAALAQQGQLSLDDDIRKYIQEVPDFGTKITIRHLVHHTSGLRDQWNLLALAGWRLDDVITKEHILKLVRHQKELNFEPGAEYLYCNTGYTLLAEIVARVAGKSFPEWTKENIFQPLGMTNTLFYDDHEKIVKNRAYSYSMQGSGTFRKRVLSYANVGATSLFTTVEDLSKWAMNFDNPVVGNRDLIKQMEERGILNKGDTLAYAFGQGVGKHKGLRLIGHGGADAGYRTYLGRFPDQQYAVLVLSNLASFNTSNMAFKIADIYLADLLVDEEPKEETKTDFERVEVDPAIFEEYVGVYEVEPGVLARVTRAGNRLMGQAPGQPRVELIPMSETWFFAEEDLQVSFQRDQSGMVFQLTIHQNGEDKIVPKVEPFSLSLDRMAEFEGDYYSDELGTTYSIVVKDSGLVVQHRRHEDFRLTPQGKDDFTAPVWFFGRTQFERDDDNLVTGFRVSSGRVRNLRFVRQ